MGQIMMNGRGYSGAKIVELTQAEYDALPESKENDGIEYFIIDSDGDMPYVIANPIDPATTPLTKIYIDGVVYYIPQGSAVIPNPSGTPSTNLESLEIDGTVYGIPEGTNVEANPIGTATNTLTKLGIDNTVYELAGGTEVIPNPTGTPTDDLETISIDGDIFTVGSGNASKVELTQAEYNALVVAGEVDPTIMYFIPDGPGSGDSGSYATLLWTNETPTSGMSANTTVTIPNLTAFDLIGIVATHNVTSGGVNANAMQIFSTSNTTADNVLVTANSGNASNYARTFTITNDTTLTFSDGMQPGVAFNSNYTVPLKIYGLRFGNGGSGGSSEVVYSTSEHKIGKWVDGSDLYERTISATISSGTNTLLNVTDIVVVEIKGVVTNGSNKSFTVPYYDNGGDYIILNQNGGGINLLITSWFINNGATSAYITIRYTKTTT